MSIKVKPTVKRIDEEIEDICICPEAMNDPENLAMRRNVTEKKFVKDYDTIKAKLDDIRRRFERLNDNGYRDKNGADCWVEVQRLLSIEKTLRWVLSEEITDL